MRTTRSWHFFLDTTALASWQVFGKARSKVASAGHKLYATDLVVEEFLAQRMKFWEGMRTAARKNLRDYVRVEPSLDSDPVSVRAHFDAVARSKLTDVTIFPAEAFVAFSEVLSRSRRREKPFAADGETGFRDCVIMIGSLNYAKEHGLTPCVFVSDNSSDFTGETIERLGAERGQEWWLAGDLHTALAIATDPDMTAAATEFMKLHAGAVARWLVEHPIRLGDWVLNGDVEIETAIGIEPAETLGEYLIHFNASVKTSRYTSTKPYLIGYFGRSRGYFDRLIHEFPPRWPIQGEATVSYQRRKFVGEPQITEVALRGLGLVYQEGLGLLYQQEGERGELVDDDDDKENPS